MRAESLVRICPHRHLQAKPLGHSPSAGAKLREFGQLPSGALPVLGSLPSGEVFEHPLDAQAAGVLAAAFSITRAAILLYFPVKPGHAQRSQTTRFRRAE
jgi:hypothetical protein